MGPDHVGPDHVGAATLRSSLIAPALSVAGAARGLGVAAATLRSWDRRYGLTPSLHTKGGHRRYGPDDLARLAVMRRLVRSGVPPAEAARVAIRAEVQPGVVSSGHAGGGPPGPHDGGAPAKPGGGQVLALPGASQVARGLARSAMALDSAACRDVLRESLASVGAVATWELLARPVLAGIGARWEATGEGVEVEHTFSAVVAGCFAGHVPSEATWRTTNFALLASAPQELHDLPLVALQAALADVGVPSHLLGARTPQRALASAITRLRPRVIFLWRQVPGRTELAPVPSLRPAPAVILGGPGWRQPHDGVEVTTDLGSAVTAVCAAVDL